MPKDTGVAVLPESVKNTDIPNEVFSDNVVISRATKDLKHTSKIRKNLTSLKAIQANQERLALKKSSPRSRCYTKTWLAQFFTNIIRGAEVPHQLKQANMKAISKRRKITKLPTH